MKRSAEDTEQSSSSSSSSSNNQENKARKKRKVDQKLRKEYMRMVAAADPTTPNENVEAKVKSRTPTSIQMIMKKFGVDENSHFTKLLPKDNIIKIVTDIVINDINEPIRQLLYSYLLHYYKLEEIVKDRILVPQKNITIAEELKQLDPPGEGEQPYSEFVELLHGIMARVIKKVAGVIEGNELFSGNSVFTNALLSQITLEHNIKTGICAYLFNEMCTFAGEVFYTFFMDDNNLIKMIVNKNISA
nr:MAG: wsv310-like protein [Chiromantes dehaani nimavirus]